MSPSNDENLVQVLFPIPEEDQTGYKYEKLWAIAQNDGTYLVDNSPFDIYEISYRDRISISATDEGLMFREVIQRGGHSTYRIRFPVGVIHDYFLTIWPDFEQFGCTYECSNRGYLLYSIDVPKGSDVQAVCSYLLVGELIASFEFEEGHYYAQD